MTRAEHYQAAATYALSMAAHYRDASRVPGNPNARLDRDTMRAYVAQWKSYTIMARHHAPDTPRVLTSAL
jgi:hypothetical protein